MSIEKVAKPWFRELWFWLLISPMLTLIVTVPIMITTAFKGADDRVLDNYYKEGRMINHRFEEQALAVSLNIAGVMEFDWQTGELWFEANQTLSNMNLVVEFSHPAYANLDFVLPLKSVDSRRFRADLVPMEKSRWYFTLQGAMKAEDSTKDNSTKDNSAKDNSLTKIWRVPGEVNLADSKNAISKVELKAVEH